MRHSFETFVVCAANEAAYRAAREREKNPLFIEGPSGSGKTHLLAAVAHELSSEGRSVDHLSARAYGRRMMQSYLYNITSEPVDALLIDDYGLIPDATTQWYYIEQFERFASRGMYVVVATHRPLPGVAPVVLGYPDTEAANEIARRAALTRGLVLQERELAYIARSEHNPRTIEGIVTRMAFARMLNAY